MEANASIGFTGRVWRDGDFWLVEVPALDAMTQGTTRADALRMIEDWVETVVDKKGFMASATDDDGDAIVVAGEVSQMTALMLRRKREAVGLSLREVAARLGQKSPNAYARYEQGKSVPTLAKLVQLLSAIDPEHVIKITM